MRGCRSAVGGIGVLALCLVLGPLRGGPAWGGGDFAYFVERFTVDGNVHGPRDGTIDFDDQFDDGLLSPDWGTFLGTSREEDGLLHLISPGGDFTSPDGQPMEISIVYGRDSVEDGEGDFRATVVWKHPGELPPGHHFHFSILTHGPSTGYSEIVGLGLQNLPTGYGVEQHRTEYDIDDRRYRGTDTVVHALDPSDVTGSVWFRIDFDDLTNLVSTSFSIDGGATWTSPFQPIEIFVDRPTAQFVVSADPQLPEGETTSTTSTSSSTTTSTTMRPAADTPISATKLVIVQDRGGTTQRHHLVSKDPGIGRTTPCQLHSEFVIDVPGVGRIAKPLQEDWWRQRSFYDPNKGCIYDDRAVTRDGLPTLIKLVQGKRLSIEVGGVPASLTPLDVGRRPILYTLQHGDHRYCMTFGDAGGKRKKRKLTVGRTGAASCTLD